MIRSTILAVTALLLTNLLTSPAHALFATPTLMPIDRIVANLEARLEATPNDHEAYYTLARAYYMAFVNGFGIVPADDDDETLEIAANWSRGDTLRVARRQKANEITLKRRGFSTTRELSALSLKENRAYFEEADAELTRLKNENWQPQTLPTETNLEFANLAVTQFKKAITMAPQNGLYHLGLASLYQQYVQYRNANTLTNEPETLTKVKLADARNYYFTAYALSIDEDLKLKAKPMAGLGSLVSFEAGKAFLELVKTTRNIPKKQLDSVPAVQAALYKLRSLKQGRVTPIILTLQRHSSLADLLDANANVLYDLDGDGIPRQWPWIKPTTGFLVWDDPHTGKITSGRQLFGSVTWWLFFQNGYQALDTLDDNRDGSLTGPELQGIAVWFDRNTNGVSDAAEVVTLQSLGIAAIRTQPTGEDQGAPMNAQGLILTNRQAIPSYDWIASPIAPASRSHPNKSPHP